MPGCSLTRETSGSIAVYRITGRFERSCAWDLSARLRQEPLREVVIDFCRVSEFIDSGVAVIATSLASSTQRVHLRGLRQHQERLFRYFGVDLDEPSSETPHLPPELSPDSPLKEVS
jgi:hypothetical protein